jgi:hypothetical protein
LNDQQPIQIDPTMPIGLSLPAGQVMGLLGVLGQMPISSGLTPLADAIRVQLEQQAVAAHNAAVAAASPAPKPVNRQQRRSSQRKAPVTPKPKK